MHAYQILEKFKTDLAEARQKGQVRSKDDQQTRALKEQDQHRAQVLSKVVTKIESYLAETNQKLAENVIFDLMVEAVDEAYERREYGIARGGTAQGLHETAVALENLVGQVFPNKPYKSRDPRAQF